VLSALILPITLAAAFGWYFMWLEGRRLIEKYGAIPSIHIPLPDEVVPLGLACALALIFVLDNDPFIHNLTHDRTGLDAIAEVEAAPPGSTVMLAWGPRHFAAGFAQDVEGRLGDITLVDHNAPFADLLAGGATLVTPQYTLFNQPPDWWESRIGTAPVLRAAGPGLVQIDTQIATPPDDADLPEGPAALRADLTCEADAAILEIDWYAAQTPGRDLSVFVHLLDANGAVIAQDDRSAPVYGWRPLSSWRPGEVVHDVYVLPRLPDAANVRYGLYYQAADGAFVNVVETARAACGEE
jgi:hypothetical protein